MLDRIRGIRRSARKLRDKLEPTEAVANERRHELYMHATSLVVYVDAAMKMLDEAKPKKEKKNGKIAQDR